MQFSYTMGAAAASLAVGFSVSWTAGDIVIGDELRPPAISVHEITIRADGSTYYDRTALEGEWIAWSGQIFGEDGSVHCRGGGLSQYFNDGNPLGARDVDWLLGDDCAEGLTEGMRWVFTWVPMDSALGEVRFPPDGYGRVIAAD